MGKVVILGGSGFVGKRLTDILHARGHQLKILTRNPAHARELAIYPRVSTQAVDVYSSSALSEAIKGTDAVINLVGILNESGRSGAGFKRAHVELTEKLIAAMKSAQVSRLIHMSALNAGHGESYYLKTRGEAEAKVKQSGLRFSIVRPSVIFGPGDGLFVRFAGLLDMLPGVLPLARASTLFQPVYVGDVAEAMARMLEREDSVGQVFELVGPRRMSLKEIVQYTAKLRGKKLLVVPLPDVLARIQGFVFDLMPLFLKAFSTDNFLSLKRDSVSAKQDLLELGIEPTRIEWVVPDYLAADPKQARMDQFRREIN